MPAMLKALRHKSTQKKIYIVLAIGVVISFVVSGILLSRDDKNTTALATIGKHKIMVHDYLDSYRAVERQASMVYGNKLNEMNGRINFKGEAWDRLLLLNYAQKQNIHASDDEVVQWIGSQPAFQSKGRFDEKLYELYIERGLHSTPRAFEEEIRQMLTIAKVQESVKSKPSWDDKKIKELYQKEKTEKDLLHAVLPWETEKDKVAVTDKDIEALYAIVKEKLTTPEQVKVSYLFVPKEKSADFKETFEDKTQTMDSISKKYNLPLKETGYFSKNDAVPDLGNEPEVLAESFTLASGEESPWTKTETGHYKIKVLDKKSERPMTLDEAREELKKIYAHQKASELVVKKLSELKNKMKSTDFEAILKAENIVVTPLEKYRAGSTPAGIYPPESLEKAAAPLKEGEISEPFAISKGAMIVKAVKVYPVDEKKFEEEKEAFKKERLEQQYADDMKELLEKLRKNLSLNLERMKEIFPT